jgi:F-type H+-transporting ATPase subunit delta
MVPVVSKKYVKALLSGQSEKKAKEYYKNLSILSNAYSLEKMKNIILSPGISKDKKYGFLISLLDKSDKSLNNFIKILVENVRVYLLPSICNEIRYQIATKENKFIGKIISSSALDNKSKKSIEEKLSIKFNSSIKLESIISDYPGIKIEIEDLGVEISFSIDRLKAQMTEHILKAI